jgi:transglutaminase-like putative cysteine protease
VYRSSHRTVFHYSEPVSVYYGEARLTPRDTPFQTCRGSRLSVRPTPATSDRRVDWFGNRVTNFTVQERHDTLTVVCVSETEVFVRPRPDPSDTPGWEAVRDAMIGADPDRTDRSPPGLDALQYVFDSRYVRAGPAALAFAKPSFPPGRPVLAAVLDLSARMFAEFKADRTATHVATPVEEVLALRRGVCQDYAQAMIAGLRSLGLSARYVSGYLLTDPPPGRPRLLGVDASHAWVGVWCPPLGWVDIDPFNNCLPGDRHITLAWGRDYDDVSPIRGVITGGGRHGVTVAVDVTPVDEA